MTLFIPAALYVGTFLAASCPCESNGVQRAPLNWESSRATTGYWTPGGYEPRIGSPYYYSARSSAGWPYYNGRGAWIAPSYSAYYGYTSMTPGALDPYVYHFGPGYYRSNEFGYYRFPYYSYRRPWYYPGPTSYNRDTNLPW